MKKICIILTVILALSLKSEAQHEPIFTQYGMNQAIFNPAYVSVNNVINVALMSRKQWVGLKGAPFTNTLMGSTTFFGNKGGAGLVIHSNVYGVTNNVEIMAQAGYKVHLGINAQLCIGLQGGYLQYKNDFSSVEEAASDPVFENTVESINKPNVGFGLFYNTNNFYIGLSIPKYIEYGAEKTTSDVLVYKRHYYGSVGAILPLGLLKLKTSGLVIFSENDLSYELGASILLAETIWAGLFTRNLTAVGAMGQIELTDRLKVGLTVELPSTELVVNQYGSYEAFVSFELAALKRQILERRYF